MKLPALACAVLIVTLGNAWSAPPSGVTRIELGSDTHGHWFDAKSDRIFYIQGENMSRTFLCVYDLATQKSVKYHFKNHHLRESFVPLRPEGQVIVDSLLVDAMKIDTLWSPSFVKDSTDHKLLQVSLADGALVREVQLAPDAAPAAMGRPEWSDKVFLLLTVRDRTFLKTLDPKTGSQGDSVAVGDFVVQHALFLEGSPRVVMDVKTPKGSRLVVFDLKARKVRKSFPLDAGLDDLQEDGTKVLAFFRPPGDLKGVVASFDLENGSPRRIASIDGEMESMVQDGSSVFVIAKDHSRPSKPNDHGFFPRNLHVIAKGGASKNETIPWTQRSGRFFGYDAKGKALLFHATQPATAWSISAAVEALAQTAKDLDRRSGEYSLKDPQTWGLLLLAVGAVAGMILQAVYYMRSGGGGDSY